MTDPLRYSLALPLVRTFYPMGFALELSTDSPDIVEAAASLWSGYPSLSGLPPVRLKIAVSSTRGNHAAIPTEPRGQGHLMSIVHGPENFAVADLAAGFGFACLTRDVAADRAYTIHYFLEPVVYMLLAATRLILLHAGCVSLEGAAVLLAGDSGAGKTCLAYSCARKGWTFVSGDTVALRRDDSKGTAVGRPFSIRFRDSARELFRELDRFPVKQGLNGKLDIEPPVEELGIAADAEARVTHLVFLRRQPGQTSMTSVSAAEAFGRLHQLVLFGDPALTAGYERSLLDFLESRPALELTYSDPGDAECALRSLVRREV